MLICLDEQRPWSVASGLTRLNFYNSCRRVALFVSRATLFAVCVTAAEAQSSLKLSESPAPVTTGVLGRTEALALTEILDHLKVVGAAPWTGMQGTGTIAYGNDDTTYKATLTIQGSSRFRLDGQASTGALSIRINGRSGKIQEPDGKVFPLLPDTAATGIFQFELPHLSNFPDSASSLIDHGTSVANGQTLHRMTFEAPVVRSQSDTKKPKTIATDLYFDPKTHLLSRSANSIHIDGGGKQSIPPRDYIRGLSTGGWPVDSVPLYAIIGRTKAVDLAVV